jgi:tetratricopeptide (TPR) repeat protein
MGDDKNGSSFLKAAAPILRKVIENIESPFVWMPLGLFILCVLAYPVTKLEAFGYLAIAFALIAFGADWVGRWRNRRTPPEPSPQTSSYRNDIFTYLASVQAKAVGMLEAGKADAARALTHKNLKAVDEALKSFPNDADFHALMGYTLKDIYQSSKGLLSTEQRKAYLNRARESFESALQLNPKNPSAHNGMANILFFERRLDEALKEHDKALQLANGNYPAAEHDRRMVAAVKAGEMPFDFS